MSSTTVAPRVQLPPQRLMIDAPGPAVEATAKIDVSLAKRFAETRYHLC